MKAVRKRVYTHVRITRQWKSTLKTIVVMAIFFTA